MVLAVTVVVALTHKQLGPGMAGFAISYSLRITRALNWLVRSSVETELGLNSVERILYYTNVSARCQCCPPCTTHPHPFPPHAVY